MPQFDASNKRKKPETECDKITQLPLRAEEIYRYFKQEQLLKSPRECGIRSDQPNQDYRQVMI